ncbi:MAG: hypothetical protein HUU47_02835 [Bacteroidetes bacterium]|nr:hypothetical protein [Bacteroidota bacterium]
MMRIADKYIRISLINLNFVALLGIILRYKIAFSLPFISQKNFLHSHSHFAFYGWISQTLFIFLVEFLYRNGTKDVFKKYSVLLIANLVLAYLMMFSFAAQGYGLFSVTFSTLSIINSYIFTVLYFNDLKKSNISPLVKKWFKSALFFNVLSSIGTFALAFMMINKVIHQNWYLSAIYFFLHFQYNGWFFFTIMGLFTAHLIKLNITEKMNTVFLMFFIACFGAYFLSVPWLNKFVGIHIWSIISSIIQFFAFVFFIGVLKSNLKIINNSFNKTSSILFTLSGIALFVKLLLQLISVYPPLSTIALSFRPIVIGYLHLVLLGIISVFLIAYIVSSEFIKLNKFAISGIVIFVFGILYNEILLLIQGIAAMKYEYVKNTNELLLSAAVVLFLGVLTIVFSQKKSLRNS